MVAVSLIEASELPCSRPEVSRFTRSFGPFEFEVDRPPNADKMATDIFGVSGCVRMAHHRAANASSATASHPSMVPYSLRSEVSGSVRAARRAGM